MSDLPADRIYLSPPHMGGEEWKLVQDAFRSNWIAPLGPHVEAFEREFAGIVGSGHAVALSSGTAALHLALHLAGVGQGDDVLVSTLTFVASVNPIVYLGARPILVDSETVSWNLDPDLVTEELHRRAKAGERQPAAVVVVHLYGQPADVTPILRACAEFGVPVVEDAAEALGARYGDASPGALGRSGIFSFNGNKILTTSGGGMLVTDDRELAAHALKLATQARDPAPHYQHSELGYNYRMSNVLAAVGRGQLRVLQDRVAARQGNFERYRERLGDLPGLSFQPEAPWGTHTRWLTCVLVDPREFGADRDAIREALEAHNIEARPLWKPMHMQPLYRDAPTLGGYLAEGLFERGLCLPSGSSLGPEGVERVVEVVRGVAAQS